MAAYSEMQEAELRAEAQGYTATRHQREVGVGYFDLVAQTIAGGLASTLALEGSTERAQFHPPSEEAPEAEESAPSWHDGGGIGAGVPAAGEKG